MPQLLASVNMLNTDLVFFVLRREDMWALSQKNTTSHIRRSRMWEVVFFWLSGQMVRAGIFG